MLLLMKKNKNKKTRKTSHIMYVGFKIFSRHLTPQFLISKYSQRERERERESEMEGIWYENMSMVKDKLKESDIQVSDKDLKRVMRKTGYRAYTAAVRNF